jgi:hypothetical protein
MEPPGSFDIVRTCEGLHPLPNYSLDSQFLKSLGTSHAGRVAVNNLL